MPQYEVMERSLVGNTVHEKGAIVDYDGLPAENLKPLDAVGEAKYQEYLDSNAKRVAAMIDANKDSAFTDPNKFMAAFAAEQKAQAEAQPALIANAIASAFAAFFPNGVTAPAVAAVEAPAAEDTAALTKRTRAAKAADDTAAPAGVTDSASA